MKDMPASCNGKAAGRFIHSAFVPSLGPLLLCRGNPPQRTSLLTRRRPLLN